MELRPWGIKVAIVEPAQTDTDMWRQAEEELDATVAALSPEHRELYAGHIAGARKMIPLAKKMASPVDGVAAVIERALTASRPRARYVVGAGPRVQGTLAGVTPTRILDGVLSRVGGVPRRL
jgi:NAD(P)-dependent dehydrogenase (short-subunit alcohol dehydrogenase family)